MSIPLPIPVAESAASAYPLLPVITQRTSKRAYDPTQPVPEPLIISLLEAARWAPSGGNRQPWCFYLARPHDALRPAFEESLSRGNAWAKSAYLLAAVVIPAGHDGPRPYLDCGLAVQNLLLQGTGHGLMTHPLGGFSAETLHAALTLAPADTVILMIALGYPGDPAALDEATRAKDEKPRTRKPLAEIAFWADAGQTPITGSDL